MRPAACPIAQLSVADRDQPTAGDGAGAGVACTTNLSLRRAQSVVWTSQTNHDEPLNICFQHLGIVERCLPVVVRQTICKADNPKRCLGWNAIASTGQTTLRSARRWRYRDGATPKAAGSIPDQGVLQCQNGDWPRLHFRPGEAPRRSGQLDQRVGPGLLIVAEGFGP